jgi:hypothetical protein
MIESIKKTRRTLDGLASLTEILRSNHTLIMIDKPFVVGTYSSPDGNNNHSAQVVEKVPAAVPCASQEVIDAIKAITMSKMYLGKCLKELGNANPYPTSKDPSSQTIEKTADVSSDGDVSYLLPGGFYEMTPTSQCKWLRASLEEEENRMKEMYDAYCHSNVIEEPLFWLMIYIRKAILSCIEAGLWLGMELSNIRNKEVQSEAH